jgi:hypothetical protein
MTTEREELSERLRLIESMIAEGRRSTESWGWTFLLWGIAYYVAVGWSNWGQRVSVLGHSEWAWPVTMFGSAALTLAIGLTRKVEHPATSLGRAVASVWTAVGISMMLIFPCLGYTGRLEQHGFVGLVAAMLGIANGASGLILKWKMQVAAAVVWWITSVAACFVSDAQLTVLFLAALFLCQIAFGIYTMICEARERRQGVAVHA